MDTHNNGAAPERVDFSKIKTSIPMHLRILQDPDFIAGKLSTAFMDRFLKQRPAAGGGLAEAV